MQIPHELSSITPFLSRAAELKQIEPIVSYYCSFYGAQLAISIGKSPESQGFLMNLLDELEKEKSALLLQNEDIMSNDLVGFAHVSNFAFKVFSSADTEDRQGRASKKTAKTFLAASLFLQVLSVFGDLDSDILEKIKYSKFKAAEIIKALKAGKTPSPGGPMDVLPDSEITSPVTNVLVTDTNTLDTSADNIKGNVVEEYKPLDHGIDYKITQQAQKLAKFAISALQYDDVGNAIQNLEKALELLKENKNI